MVGRVYLCFEQEKKTFLMALKESNPVVCT